MKKSTKKEIMKAKGDEAEQRFKEWLDIHKIPYLYIHQNEDTFSSAFKPPYMKGKRPDFMVLIPNLGFIFVDVKNRTINKPYKTYPLDAEETKKFSNLQRVFNIHVWYAISNEHSDFQTWLWIPVSKVLEEGVPKYVSSKTKAEFYAISPSKFTQISINDSMDRLLSKCFME